MTKRKWLACKDAQQGLSLLGPGASARKLRLFACACCQAVLPAAGAAARATVEAAERFADGLATRKELTAARDRAGPGARGSGPRWRQGVAFACFAAAEASAYRAAEGVLTGTLIGTVSGPVRRDSLERRDAQRALLRDIFRPYRPIAVPGRWRTADVLGLARGVYEDRAFDRLSVLADALMDAGCDHEELLAHCRSAGPHARGCWAVDLLLGKV